MRSALIAHDAARSAIPVYFVDRSTLPDRFAMLGARAKAWAEANDYDGTAGRLLIVPDETLAPSAVLFGVKTSGMPGFAAGELARKLPPGLYRFELGADAAPMAALGFALGSYRFRRYLNKSEDARPQVMVGADVDLDGLLPIIDGVALTRDLINTPANDLGPAELGAL